VSCIIEIEGDISPLPGNAAGEKERKKKQFSQRNKYQDGGKTYV
jgi:hypothetical protein